MPQFSQQLQALSRINRIAVGHGLRIMSLEQEVDALCRRYGQPSRYAAAGEPGAAPADNPSPAPVPPEGAAPLEAVLCNDRLARRAARAPDHAAENRMLACLVQALADAPGTVFQVLAESIVQGLPAGSAGVSLLTRDGKLFYTAAIAGAWQACQGIDTPTHFSPCGDAVERQGALLFEHPERRYAYLSVLAPAAQELLLVPFHVKGMVVGTVWAVSHEAGQAHGGQRPFDAEDVRQLASLGRFASGAYQTTLSLDAALEQGRTALGLMEDAVLQAHQAMEKLYESREHYRSRFESIEEGFCIMERVQAEGEPADFRYVEANPAFSAQTGLGDVTGKTLREVMPDDFESRFQICDSVLTTGEPVRARRPVAHLGRMLELYAFRLEDGTGQRVAVNFQDITDRHQAEDLVARQAAELARLYATAPVGLFVFDADLRFIRVNQAMAELNGLPAEQHVGRTLHELLSPELAAPTEALLRQVLDTGEPVLNHEVQGATLPRPGQPRHWLVNYHPVQGANGAVQGVHGAVQEITERKRAEQALRESQRFLRSSLDALSGHIAVLDESGTILQINEAWRRFAIENQSSSTAVGVGVNYLAQCEKSFAQGDRTPDYLQGIQDVMAGRRTYFEMEYPCHSPAKKRWFVMRVSRFHSPGPARIVIVHDDCTERKLAEQASRESEERYRNLFSLMDEGFCLLEIIFDDHQQAVDCRFLEVNPAFAKQTGYPDIQGRRLREVAPRRDAHWLKMCGQVALSGEPVRYIHEEKGERSLWFDVYAARLGSARHPKVAIVFNNITKSTVAADALRNSEQRFRALFENGPTGIFYCDRSGAIQEFNRAAVELYGQKPAPGESVENFRRSLKLYLPDGSWMSSALTQRVLRGELPMVQDMELIVERPDGSRITGIVSIVPLRNSRGEIAGVINSIYDITERSRLQYQTQEQARALAEQHRHKDEFLAMLGHELRNPLAPLSSAVHLLRLQKNEAPLQRQALDIIERQAGQLKHLVDDLMEMSRITSGSIQLRQERIQVGDVVQAALETVQPLMAEHGHALTVSAPPQPVWLHADAARLEQVLVNLLTNAAKYTNPGGQIWLSVEADTQAAQAVIRVRDTGIGIAAELLPRIFELFTQAERSLDRSQGGLGIGLCLVKRLVGLHGGTVQAHSVLGEGSEFVVRLPALAESMPPPEPSAPQPLASPAPAAGKGCRVLAVDDNEDAVRTLAMLLKMSGHEVQIAYDGLSALDMARAMPPDVMLLDIGLPGLTGYEVAEQVRQDPALKDTVLVALTGYGRAGDRQFSHDVGFDYHLVKPADFGEVDKILAAVCARNAARD